MIGGRVLIAVLLVLGLAGEWQATRAQDDLIGLPETAPADETPAEEAPADEALTEAVPSPPVDEALLNAARAEALSIENATPEAASSATAPNANPLSWLEIEQLSATRSLPLFTPSRSPPVVETVVEAEPEPVVEEVVVEEAAPTPPALKLIGVIRTSTEEVALLSDESTGEIHRIRPKEDYEGWTMRIVDNQTVEFQNAELRHALKMFEPGSDPPAVAQQTPAEFGEGHAFGAPAADGSEMMGGDLDFSGETALDENGNPVDGNGNPIDGAPLAPQPQEPGFQNGYDQSLEADGFMPEAGGQPQN